MNRLREALLNWRTVEGRAASRKMHPLIASERHAWMPHTFISRVACSLTTNAIPSEKLPPSSRKNARPRAMRNSPCSGLEDTRIAPKTTTSTAAHCSRFSTSPRNSTATMAANTGAICCTGTARDTSSIRSAWKKRKSPSPHSSPLATAHGMPEPPSNPTVGITNAK